MDDDVTAVVRLELLLLEPEFRNDADQVLRLLHRDFYEYGSSGRVWDRQQIADAINGKEYAITATKLQARRLGLDVILVTYVSRSGVGLVLRSSTWIRDGASWLLLFHHGTLASGGRCVA